jgi:hypothetical protein
MCCGSKRSGTRGSKSGRITRARKTIQTQAIETKNEQQEPTENRERLFVLSVGRPTDETRNLGSSEIQGPELLP